MISGKIAGMKHRPDRSVFQRSLSAKLLMLTVACLLVASFSAYVPSVANFREAYLIEKLVAAQLAALALEATPTGMVDNALEQELLSTAGVVSVSLRRDDRHILMLGGGVDTPVSARYDLRNTNIGTLIIDAFATLLSNADNKAALVRGVPTQANAEYIDIVILEAPLRSALWDYSTRVMGISFLNTMLTAGVLFLALHVIVLGPMRRITQSMTAFRTSPEDMQVTLRHTDRADEMGMAQRELRTMQEELRTALHQKSRLASLGTAVTKISHDLRNILATAQLVSDRLSDMSDPALQPIVPPLIRSIARAIDLCERTLRHGRADELELEMHCQPLRPLVEDVRSAVGLEEENSITFHADIPPGVEIDVDADQMHRALLNLVRNAHQALSSVGGGEIVIKARPQADAIVIDVIDNGPGLPQQARAHLFEPFAVSTRSEGTGLGLIIARDIIRAHKGDLELKSAGPGGTIFRIRMPLPVDRPQQSVG